MTWNAGPCVPPGGEPTPAVRAIHEAEIRADLEALTDEPGPGAARWPGHEIEDNALERLRDGLGEL